MAEWRDLPEVRFGQSQGQAQPKATAFPLLRLQGGFLRQDWNGHAGVQAPSQPVGDRGFPHDHQPEGRVEYEAPSEPGITQKTAWHLSHRIREALRQDGLIFKGPVEVDETYFGRKYKNMPRHRRPASGRGVVGKVPVVGTTEDAHVYTDNWGSLQRLASRAQRGQS